ncbi:MAG: hypothetical protein ACYC7E_15425 [Armatimonadota bacterium]
MKEWMNNGNGGLPGLRRETKVIYTLYLLTSILGFLVIGVLAATRSGITPESIAVYYAGNEAEGIYGKTFGELIELTHFHLFAIPLWLLVLGHVFCLCRWPFPIKIWVVIAAFLGVVCQIATPWLVVYVSQAWAPLLIAARVLLGIPLILFLIVPLWEMWFGRGGADTGG